MPPTFSTSPTPPAGGGRGGGGARKHLRFRPHSTGHPLAHATVHFPFRKAPQTPTFPDPRLMQGSSGLCREPFLKVGSFKTFGSKFALHEMSKGLDFTKEDRVCLVSLITDEVRGG